MRGRKRLLAFLLISILAVVTLVALATSASAADRDIYGNWVINGGVTHVQDETIDVRGNVIIQGGGTLKLERCTLGINGTQNGDRRLEVGGGGRLEVYNSTVLGNDARISVRFNDDVLFQGSTLKHVHGSGWDRGVVVHGGQTVMVDSVLEDVNNHGFYAQADLSLDNVTVRDVDYSAVYIYNWGADSDYTVQVENCKFYGPGTGSYYSSGVNGYVTSQGRDVDLLVKDTYVTNYRRGAYIYASGGFEGLMEGCRITGCLEGINLNQTGGDMTLRSNVVTQGSGASQGIIMRVSSSVQITIHDNIVSHVDTGWVFSGPWSGSYTGSYGYLGAENCSRGITATGNIRMTVHNSTVTNCVNHFWASNGATITVIDTEHVKGSGGITGTSSWIRAYTEVEILGARWKGGSPIMSGALVLENRTEYEVARFDLAYLEPQDVVGWEVDSSGRRTFLYLYPALYMGGHGFRGERIDIWGTEPTDVELVDDVMPEMDTITPDDGSGFNTTSVLAKGTYTELGSGVATLQYKLDAANWTDFSSYHGGNWSIPMVDLGQGLHALSVKPIDRAGNVGDIVRVTFTIDTVVPFISLDDRPTLVNTTTILVSGSTEENVTVDVNGIQTQDEAGRFEVTLELAEGLNSVVVSIMDVAGNLNLTSFMVTLDTLAPPLVVSSPQTDTWTNARSVVVEGTTENNVDLRVNGLEVTVNNGTFRKRIDLEELEEFAIRVTSADRAGNVASLGLTLFVDWTAPSLVLVQPEGGTVVTQDTTLYITGDVDDPSVDHVVINGNDVSLTSGRFIKQYTLVEGDNHFVIEVVDAAGNRNSTNVLAERDLTPPTYEVELEPIGGELFMIEGEQYCTAPQVEVHATFSEVVIVKLGDGAELPPSKEIRVKVDLEEGNNNLQLIIRDRAGNQAQSYSERVILDTSEPPIILFEPTDNQRTREESVVIHGKTDEGSTLEINGQPVNLLTGGEFRRVMPLEDGTNSFTIEVVDPMGNTNTTTVSVLREAEEVETQDSSSGMFGGLVVGVIIGVVVGVVVGMMFAGRRAAGAGAPQKEKAPWSEPSDEGGPDEAPSRRPPEGKGPGGGDWEEY